MRIIRWTRRQLPSHLRATRDRYFRGRFIDLTPGTRTNLDISGQFRGSLLYFFHRLYPSLPLINSINMLAERYASEEEREERVRSDKLEANVCIASAFFELLMPGFVEIEEEKERRILEKKRRGKEDGRLFGGRGKWQTFSKQNINYTQT